MKSAAIASNHTEFLVHSIEVLKELHSPNNVLNPSIGLPKRCERKRKKRRTTIKCQLHKTLELQKRQTHMYTFCSGIKSNEEIDCTLICYLAIFR